MEAGAFQKVGRDVLVEIVRGVREGGEDEDFLVPRIDGRGQLAEDRRLDVLELRVVGRRDFPHLGEKGFEDGEVGA